MNYIISVFKILFVKNNEKKTYEILFYEHFDLNF